MSKYKRKNSRGLKKTITTIASILAILIFVGVFAGVFRDTTKIGPLAFEIGGLDENGEYVKQNHTLFTKELVTCDGLEISVDFDSTSSYEVFFYDEEKAFMESTGELVKNLSTVPEGAEFCRIVISPEIPADEEVEDFKISFFDKVSYVNDFEIVVDKK